MSDEVKVEPAKAAKNEVTELKAKLDNLSAYVRKIAKNFEKLSGIDLNADGKIGLIVIGLFMCASVAFSAETLITGVGSNYTGIGTYQVTSDGTLTTMTVDKLVALTSATIAMTNGDLIVGNIPQIAITNALLTAGSKIGGNIPVAAITNAAGTLGASIGGSIPVAAVTNALNQTASAVTNVIVSADAKTNTFIIAPVGQVNVIRSWVVTQ